MKYNQLALIGLLTIGWSSAASEADMRCYGVDAVLILSGDDGEITYNGLSNVSETERSTVLENTKTINLGGTRPYSFYILDSNANVVNSAASDDPNVILTVDREGKRYFKCSGHVVINLNLDITGSPLTKELFDADNKLLWRCDEMPGRPYYGGDLSLIVIADARSSRPGRESGLTIIKANGRKTLIEDSGWSIPIAVAADGTMFAVPEYDLLWERTLLGTRVYSDKGKLLFTLDREVRHVLHGYTAWSTLAITDRYIIQTGERAEKRFIQVYGRSGDLLWEGRGFYFKTSANGESMVIAGKSTASHFDVKYSATGKTRYRINPGIDQQRTYENDIGISNNGRYVSFAVNDHPSLGNEVRASIFRDGKKIIEFEKAADPGDKYPRGYSLSFLNGVDGFVIADGLRFRVFLIK